MKCNIFPMRCTRIGVGCIEKVKKHLRHKKNRGRGLKKNKKHNKKIKKRGWGMKKHKSKVVWINAGEILKKNSKKVE